MWLYFEEQVKAKTESTSQIIQELQTWIV